MKNLEKEIDRLHSLYCRLMWPKCVTCGSRRNLEPAHIFTRAAHNTRWDMLDGGNCTTQCHACNDLHERNAQPLESWFIKKNGMQAFEDLKARTWIIKQWREEELKELKTLLKMSVCELRKRPVDDFFLRPSDYELIRDCQ